MDKEEEILDEIEGAVNERTNEVDELTPWKLIKLTPNRFRCMFGIFGGLLAPVSIHYIRFLNLYSVGEAGEDLKKGLKKIDRILEKKSTRKIQKGIERLLKAIDWRVHIVACVAITKLEETDQQLFIPILWQKLRKDGSWVEPQLLAVLSLIDHNFSINYEKFYSYKISAAELFQPDSIERGWREQILLLNRGE